MSLLDTRSKSLPTIPTTINQGTKVDGDITSDSDIRIDGQLKGNVSSKSKVVVGPTGAIDGNIVCQNADISGKIIGNIKANELLFLKATGVITGNIEINKLIVENGSKFLGSCIMEINNASKHEAPIIKVATL
jgi:cytoskeletal protein CcmA (bactofilin family)